LEQIPVWDSHRRRPTRAPLLVVIATALLLLILGGCENMNPLSDEDFYVPIAKPEQTREIETIDFSDQSSIEPVSVEAAAEAMAEAGWVPTPLAAAGEPAELTLAEVRAAALANNLDLEVALFDPTIAAATVAEEEAVFEAVFTASARRSRTDTPTASQLSSSTATIDDFDLGVDIPLRTGGRVDVNLPINRTKTSNIFATLNPSYNTDLRVSLSQPLLRNAGLRANTFGIRVAKYQQDISEALTKLEAIRVLAAADRVYWNLYASRQALEVAMQQYDLAVAQLERARRRYNAEVAPLLDVTRAESGVAQRLEAIIVAENTVLQRQRELKRVMNRDAMPMNSPIELVPATEPNPVGLELDAPALAAFAVDNRMEMLEQELQLAIDMSRIDFEQNQALPLVTLDYTYNVNGLGGNLGNSFDQLAQKSFEDWSVGLNVEIPIGNEAAESRVHRAILQRLQRLATRDLRAQSIRQEVFDAIDRLEADWQRILAARQAVILAAEVLAGEERQFEQGVRTSTDVLDAATQLADAQLSEIQALVDYQVTQVDLAFATGTLLGRDRIRWAPAE